jgi:hypothetical protein
MERCDSQAELALLDSGEKRIRSPSNTWTSTLGRTRSYFAKTSERLASMNCGVAPIRSAPPSPPVLRQNFARLASH